MQFGIVSFFFTQFLRTEYVMGEFLLIAAVLYVFKKTGIFEMIKFLIKVRIALWIWQILSLLIPALLACWVIDAFMRRPH